MRHEQLFTSKLRRYLLYLLKVFVVIFFVAAPFITTSNGHNLIRFDVDTLNLYFFNSVISFDHFFNVSLLILMSVFLFIITAQVFGRVWCGWLCPQAVMSDIVITISHKFKSTAMKKVAEIILSAAVSFIFALTWIFYFVSPYDMVTFLDSSGASAGVSIFLVLFIICFIDYAFIRYTWCKYICPYSKMQSLMSDENTLYVGMLPNGEKGCIKCLACVKVCPTGIDARVNPQNDCLSCEKCINACRRILQKCGKPPVLGYVWGQTGRLILLRVNLLITCFVFVLLSCLFFYNIVANKPLYLDILSVTQETQNILIVKTRITSNEAFAADITLSVLPEGAATVSPDLVSFGFRGKKEMQLRIEINEDVPLTLKAITDKGFERIINIKNKEQ